MTRHDSFAEAVANFSFADPRLEPLQEAVTILSGLCRGFAFSAHSDEKGLAIQAKSTRGSVYFTFESAAGRVLLSSMICDREDWMLDTFPLHWDGPWHGSRPRWEPSAVAGLIIAELGMRAAV